MRRRSRLAAKTGLARRTPLRTSREKRSGRRDTGPDRTTRELVLERDDYRCVGCGALIIGGGPYSLQHRVARGMGGTRNPRANSPVNLITLCGSATSADGCHLFCEQRNPELRDMGLWLPSWEDPADVPVHHSTHGLVYLTDDGGVRPVPHVDGDDR